MAPLLVAPVFGRVFQSHLVRIGLKLHREVEYCLALPQLPDNRLAQVIVVRIVRNGVPCLALRDRGAAIIARGALMPRQAGAGFELAANWSGFALVALGAVLLVVKIARGREPGNAIQRAGAGHATWHLYRKLVPR